MAAEDPLFILYTSGSTGKPKGVLHTTAGYLVYAAMTHKYVFDYHPGDIYCCAADIVWTTTFAKRLMVQLDQLRHYRRLATACLERARHEPNAAPLLELLEARLALAIKSAEDDLVVLDHPGAEDAEWRIRLARVAREMTSSQATRLADARQVSDLVERALAGVQDDGLATQLCILRAELATQGLTAAGTHVRINAVQLHNAIRKTIGMDHRAGRPDAPADLRQRHLQADRDGRAATINSAPSPARRRPRGGCS